jgi:hypothetical protein
MELVPPISLPRALLDMSALSTVADIDESMRTEKLLSNYTSLTKKDDTIVILESFLEFLPKRGRLQLMVDIELSAAAASLRDLRDYLMGCLIIPSRYS